MIKRPDTRGQRIKRHNRVRGKISGTAERPRLCVFRSESNIYLLCTNLRKRHFFLERTADSLPRQPWTRR